MEEKERELFLENLCLKYIKELGNANKGIRRLKKKNDKFKKTIKMITDELKKKGRKSF